MWKEIAPYLVPLIALGFVLRRAGRVRTVKLDRIWIFPGIITLLSLFTLVTSPMPGLLALGGFVLALAAGIAIGWLRARHMELSVDEATGNVTSKSTPIGTLLIAALFALRFGLKLAFPDIAGASPTMGQNAHPSATALLWADASLLFAMGLIWGRAVTTWLRAKPLLDAHRGIRDTTEPQ